MVRVLPYMEAWKIWWKNNLASTLTENNESGWVDYHHQYSGIQVLQITRKKLAEESTKKNNLMHTNYENNDLAEKSSRQPTAHNTARARILVQVTIYRRLLIGRDGHLDQSEAYDIS